MRQAVADAFWNFTAPKEGYLDYMYTDVKNLVTTGMGNLIDPVGTAIGLPWRHRGSGAKATQAEIIDTWNKVKARKDLAPMGGGKQKKYYDEMGIDLYLEPSDIKALVDAKLANNESILRKDFPQYDVWPADAQLGLHSMAWAMGAAFAKKFPSFTKAVNQMVPNFEEAARQSHITGLNSDRQNADFQLFMNAARVMKENLDPDELLLDITAGGALVSAGIKGAQAAGKALGKKAFPVGACLLGIGLAGGLWVIGNQYVKASVREGRHRR